MHRLHYLLGLLTLAAVLVGGWFLLRVLDRDELDGMVPFYVEFADARGLREGAHVRCRGVSVGTVQHVDLLASGHRARARILLDDQIAEVARAGTVFWVVSPRFEGITDGASGLDTLVRDSYIAFFTPEDAGPPLAPGSTVLGRETPPDLSGEDTLIPARHGDLLMDLLVPSNHGLEPGSRVAFRGMTTGEVRSVRLAKSGTHVEIALRIAREYRHTITDRSKFWIARPNVSAKIIGGLSVDDLDALLDAYVAYYSEPGVGLPVTDGYRAAATAERPDFEMSPVPGPELVNPTPPAAAHHDALRTVRVVYVATEEDPLANDEIRRESSGVLLVDQNGQVAVVTTRSACDAAWFDRDAFDGEPEIVEEDIKVVLPSGPVLDASRVWTHPRADLAILVVHDAAQDLPVTAAASWDFYGGIPPLVQVVAVDAKGAPLEGVRARALELPAVAEHRGALLLDEAGERIVGILGQAGPTRTESAGLSLTRIPEPYRPAR